MRSLVVCLAPPPGEYEVVLEGFAGSSIVVNDEGIWVRSLARDEWLPFIEARDRAASVIALEQALRINGMDWGRLVCMIIRGLREAASHGSLRARRKLVLCRELVESLEKEYCTQS